MPLSISSATIPTDGSKVTVVIAGGTNPILPASGATGFTAKIDGVVTSFSSTSTTTATITLNLAVGVRASQVVTLSYSAGNVTDSAGSPLPLPTVVDMAVTNNSTQVYPTSPLTLVNQVRNANVLTWDAVGGASSYRVYRNGVQVGSTSSTTYTDVVVRHIPSSYHITSVNASNIESIILGPSAQDSQIFSKSYINNKGETVNPYSVVY